MNEQETLAITELVDGPVIVSIEHATEMGEAAETFAPTEVVEYTDVFPESPPALGIVEFNDQFDDDLNHIQENAVILYFPGVAQPKPADATIQAANIAHAIELERAA